MSDVKHTEERTKTHSCVSPCDICKHYPPSSADGKPCSMCPAEPAEPTEQVRTYMSLADCVSRQAAIDALTHKWDGMVTSVFDVLKELPSAEPKWVPVSEGLPEDWKDVLVWFEYFRYGDYNCMYSTYGIGNYVNQYDSWLINHETGWKDLHVFAWMPMPEPYEEGDNE